MMKDEPAARGRKVRARGTKIYIYIKNASDSKECGHNDGTEKQVKTDLYLNLVMNLIASIADKCRVSAWSSPTTRGGVLNTRQKSQRKLANDR